MPTRVQRKLRTDTEMPTSEWQCILPALLVTRSVKAAQDPKRRKIDEIAPWAKDKLETCLSDLSDLLAEVELERGSTSTPPRNAVAAFASPDSRLCAVTHLRSIKLISTEPEPAYWPQTRPDPVTISPRHLRGLCETLLQHVATLTALMTTVDDTGDNDDEADGLDAFLKQVGGMLDNKDATLTDLRCKIDQAAGELL